LLVNFGQLQQLVDGLIDAGPPGRKGKKSKLPAATGLMEFS